MDEWQVWSGLSLVLGWLAVRVVWWGLKQVVWLALGAWVLSLLWGVR